MDSWSERVLLEFRDAPDHIPFCAAPEKLTTSGKRFFEELHRALSILILLSNVTTFADNAAFVAQKAIAGAGDLPRDFDPFTPLARIADNFTTYLSEIIRECLKSRPETLRSKETITFEAALRCDSMEELREMLVDRKVDELAYIGFAGLSEWISDRLGVQPLLSHPTHGAISGTLEARNCIVHNRGRVSAKYIRSIASGDGTPVVGSQLEINFDRIFLAARATSEFAKYLDALLMTKFHLHLSP